VRADELEAGDIFPAVLKCRVVAAEPCGERRTRVRVVMLDQKSLVNEFDETFTFEFVCKNYREFAASRRWRRDDGEGAPEPVDPSPQNPSKEPVV